MPVFIENSLTVVPSWTDESYNNEMTRIHVETFRGDWLEGLGPLHSGFHSKAYSEAVANRILPLDGRPADVIRDELQLIANELIEGTFPW